MTDDLAILVRAVLANLDATAVLALADCLAEHGREKDAVLLRRRCATWQKDRGKAKTLLYRKLRSLWTGRTSLQVWESCDDTKVDRERESIDDGFVRYIRSRFQPRKKPTPPAPHTCARPRTCSCSMSADEPDYRCPIHGGGEWPPQCATCGRIMPHTREGATA